MHSGVARGYDEAAPLARGGCTSGVARGYDAVAPLARGGCTRALPEVTMRLRRWRVTMRLRRWRVNTCSRALPEVWGFVALRPHKTMRLRRWRVSKCWRVESSEANGLIQRSLGQRPGFLDFKPSQAEGLLQLQRICRRRVVFEAGLQPATVGGGCTSGVARGYDAVAPLARGGCTRALPEVTMRLRRWRVVDALGRCPRLR